METFGVAGLARLPVTRVKRRYKASALTAAVAGVPEAAVKAVTRTATVCPGSRMDASVPPKVVTGTIKPLVSTRKGPGLTRVMFTGVASVSLPASRLLEVRSEERRVGKECR